MSGHLHRPISEKHNGRQENQLWERLWRGRPRATEREGSEVATDARERERQIIYFFKGKFFRQKIMLA